MKAFKSICHTELSRMEDGMKVIELHVGREYDVSISTHQMVKNSSFDYYDVSIENGICEGYDVFTLMHVDELSMYLYTYEQMLDIKITDVLSDGSKRL